MSKPQRRTLRDDYPDDIIDYLVKIKVELNGKFIECDFSADLEIDYDILEIQLAEHPSKFAFWSTILSEQKFITSKLERMVATRRAKIYEANLEKAREHNAKFTKYELDEMVETDDQFISLNVKLLLEGRKLGKLYGVVDALRMKGENMRSLAGFKRQELRDTADS